MRRCPSRNEQPHIASTPKPRQPAFRLVRQILMRRRELPLSAPQVVPANAFVITKALIVHLADDRTVHDKARGLKRAAVGCGDGAVIGKPLNRIDILLQKILPSGDRRVAPLRQIDVPHRSVTALIGRPAQHIAWIEPIRLRTAAALRTAALRKN